MRTGRGFERLVNFTDAVVAIALTLLILPLVEVAGEIADQEEPVGDVLYHHRGDIYSFFISFLVIWFFWMSHHQILEHFRGYTEGLMWLHMVWLLTIVTLPFSTQLLATDSYSLGAAPLYISTLLVSAAALAAINILGRRKPEMLLHTDKPEVQQWLAHPVSFFTIGVMVIALAISLIFPEQGVWGLILLLLERPFDRVWAKVRHRPAPEPDV
jgi:uncharacterized membrane protein